MKGKGTEEGETVKVPFADESFDGDKRLRITNERTKGSAGAGGRCRCVILNNFAAAIDGGKEPISARDDGGRRRRGINKGNHRVV